MLLLQGQARSLMHRTRSQKHCVRCLKCNAADVCSIFICFPPVSSMWNASEWVSSLHTGLTNFFFFFFWWHCYRNVFLTSCFAWVWRVKDLLVFNRAPKRAAWGREEEVLSKAVVLDPKISRGGYFIFCVTFFSHLYKDKELTWINS